MNNNKQQGDTTMNESYKDKFNATMKEFGINSLDDLKSDEDKKKFFKAVDVKHDAKNEEQDIPKGYHRMPDGTLMKNSDHKKDEMHDMKKDDKKEMSHMKLKKEDTCSVCEGEDCKCAQSEISEMKKEMDMATNNDDTQSQSMNSMKSVNAMKSVNSIYDNERIGKEMMAAMKKVNAEKKNLKAMYGEKYLTTKEGSLESAVLKSVSTKKSD